MKKKLTIAILSLFIAFKTIAQQIPQGSCGIVYIYDAAGNRTKRLYYCNNGGPYPTFANPNVSKQPESNIPFTKEEMKNMEFQEVDALYPNPTSGIFFITFSKALQNSSISITDNNGKMIQQFKSSGQKLTCNLANVAAGTYFIRIEDGNTIIVKKIVKQ